MKSRFAYSTELMFKTEARVFIRQKLTDRILRFNFVLIPGVKCIVLNAN